MATRFPFTKSRLEALDIPPTGRVYVHDAGQDNLTLCVTAGGSKTFYRAGRVNGRPVRILIGKFPDLSVEQARKLVRKMAGAIAEGKDPHQERQARKHEQTLQGLFDWWIEHAKARGKKTWEADKWLFDRYFAGLKTRKLSSIHKADVAAWHTKIGKTAPYGANRGLSLLRAMFNQADNIGFLGPNPAKGVKPFAEESRCRFLQPDELPRFFAALSEEPEIFQDLIMLCLLTGARRGNVQSMTWADVDLPASTWRIPPSKSKNAKTILVHLPCKAVEILQRRKAENGESPWVFPSPGTKNRDTHLQSPKGSWERIRTRAGLPDLRMHDLRRTLGSWLAIGGASLQVVGAALGHKSLQATEVYSRLTQAPVVEAVDRATSALLTAANGQGGGNDRS